MPTYEYRCDACGYAFERFQSITADPIKKCPECGNNKVKRLIGTGAGMIFKGSGFYITDYRDKSYSDKAKAESGGGGGGAGGDAKPAGDSGSSSSSSPSTSSDAEPAATKSDAPAAAKPEPKPRSDSKKKR
jgi:putative FmdB family regulatory protein